MLFAVTTNGGVYGWYGVQYEACYVASQLAQLGTLAVVQGPGGVHTTFYPKPAPRPAAH